MHQKTETVICAKSNTLQKSCWSWLNICLSFAVDLICRFVIYVKSFYCAHLGMEGWGGILEVWFCPFSTSSFSNTALFGKRGEVGQLHTLFPNLHVFFLAHKPVNLLSLNTEVTPTPWLQKMHWFALLKKVIKYRKLSSWHCWKMNVQGKWSQWDSQGNIYMCGVRRRWMSCAGRGEHLPCTCGGRLWHKPWAWADPLFFFP